MDRSSLAALLTVSENQFESAAAELRRIRGLIDACDAQLSDLLDKGSPHTQIEEAPFALMARTREKWRQRCLQNLIALRSERAALAVSEFEAKRTAQIAFGRVTAIKALLEQATSGVQTS